MNKFLITIILSFFTISLMEQNSRADSLLNMKNRIESEAHRKIDSITLEVDLKMTELETRMNDSLMKKQIYMENETAEFQRIYQLELEKIQLMADKDSLPANEVDKMVLNLESGLEMEQDALEKQMELEMKLLNDYFEQLQLNIEKDAEIEMQKIEVEYSLKMKKLEQEL